MTIARAVLASLVACAACASARAQVEASLPLEGYFRAGQYMPVHLRAGRDAPLRDVTIAGEGVVPTLVNARGGAVVVPVLITSAAAREIVVTRAGESKPIRLPLRELPADRQMIGQIRGAGNDLGRFVPPAPTIVRVELDRALVRQAPPVALEMLQAILLDDPSLIGDPGAWLASGVQVLLVGRAPPDSTWPWVEAQGLSLLRLDLLGPRSAVLGEDAYLPARGWSPGRPAALRRQVVLAGVLFAIVAVACALLPRRAIALTSVAAAAVGACAAVFAWQRAYSPLNLLAGQIAVVHEKVAQWDQWTYFTSRPRMTASMPFHGSLRPTLVDAVQGEAASLRLHWSDDESRRFFEFEVGNDSRLAFNSRTVSSAPAPTDAAPLDGRNGFAPLARALYRDERYVIAGQTRHAGPPVVLIVRRP